MKKLKTELEYQHALHDLDVLMKKGEDHISDQEAEMIESLALAIQSFEKTYYPFPIPKTIPEMVELKRFQLKLTQAALADMLGLGKPKLSQILNGKREPDVPFLKAVYQKLGVDPGFLLDNA
ncbi:MULTISPECIES: helix-turn-helix domain-containing protein [Dyadobacter]|uniref:Helix-turn-helix transcriptional regulator n=1 Tax=Dyadobacter chenhuakuii TaxID=2909339 RepID=A0A9X1TR02_9BACT|nr:MULTISPECIES: helix-turn-helix domain-containing protein [Dyadobacter]MCF2497394.1 helix-turn-helix transcriptional regulator [Dyadobacter chenhuakuii]MCF2519570.1 helix-turn-helix transcriptional regulator [Dyadobacter sp. CY351]